MRPSSFVALVIGSCLLGTTGAYAQPWKPTHRVIKTDVCWANVADSASKKWTVRKGATVAFIYDQGSYTRVRLRSGPECSIATGSIKKL
jgi:hypothetical protein